MKQFDALTVDVEDFSKNFKYNFLKDGRVTFKSGDIEFYAKRRGESDTIMWRCERQWCSFEFLCLQLGEEIAGQAKLVAGIAFSHWDSLTPVSADLMRTIDLAHAKLEAEAEMAEFTSNELSRLEAMHQTAIQNIIKIRQSVDASCGIFPPNELPREVFLFSPQDGFSMVYFLMRDSECVYVGKTNVGAARVGQHSLDKTFNQVFVCPCMASDLDHFEMKWIKKLKPIYNSAGLPKKRNR